MIDLHERKLVARLPALGPLVGWRRAEGSTARLRLWAKADALYMSARPLAAVTAVWDGAALRRGSARFWAVCSASMPYTNPAVIKHFALAEVDAGAAAAGGRIRMAFVHAIPKAISVEDAFKPKDFVCATPGSLEPMPVSEIPAPATVDFNLLGADAWSADDLVMKLFDELASALATQRGKAAAIIPDTLSRQARRVEHIEDCEVRWQPATRDAGTVLRFAAGCCRYPGVGFDQDLAERGLGGLAACAKDRKRPDFVVMLGDQVYADATAGVLDLEEGVEKYSTRYDAAFGSPAFREVTSRLPTYMLADDHELRDGWPNDLRPGPDAPEPHWDRSAWWAWGLYLLHQRWHGPDRPGWWPDAPVVPGRRASLWYAFQDNGVPFFAFDARFERERAPRTLVGPDQMEAFRRWLAAAADRERANAELRHIPKFVMSGSVIAPGLRHYEDDEACARRSDSWQAYAQERGALAHLVLESGLQNVVFLSGDYHCAAVGALDFHPAAGVARRGYAIVAPPLYAPFPFANTRADSVSREGCIAWQGRRVASCHAEARAMQGFAMVSVVRAASEGTADDWEVHVEFLRDCWDAQRAPALEPCARAKLAGGEAAFL